MLKLAAKKSIRGIIVRTSLPTEAVEPEQRDTGLSSIECPTFPYQPDAKIQSPGCLSKTRNGFPFHGNAVLVDLLMKRLAEGNGVLVDSGVCVGCGRV